MAAPREVALNPRARSYPAGRTTEGAVDLYWLPLGAGGSFVRFNGSVYEAFHAVVERRSPLALYHCGLEVRVLEGRFVIELTPVPDRNGAARGVVGEGPVGSRWLARSRLFRYELRCWRDGVIADVDRAVASPQRLTDDPGRARRLLADVASAPMLVWGRDELRVGETSSGSGRRSGTDEGSPHRPRRCGTPAWRSAGRCDGTTWERTWGRSRSFAGASPTSVRAGCPRSRPRVHRPASRPAEAARCRAAGGW